MTVQADELMRHWPALLRVAEAALRDRTAAEDCAADVVLWALERPDRLHDVENVEAFLVRVVHRRAVDHVRRRAREDRRDRRLSVAAEPPAGDVADRVAERQHAAWLAAQARARLTPAAYRAVTGFADGASADEVASSLGITRRAAESHLRWARTKLRPLAAALSASAAWCAIRVKRPAVAALPGVALAAAVLAPHLAPAPDGAQVAPATAALVERPATAAAAPRVVPGRLPGQTGTPAAPVAPRQSAAPTSSPVARVDAAVVWVDVSKEHDPTAPDTLAEDVVHCVENLELSPDVVGCPARAA